MISDSDIVMSRRPTCSPFRGHNESVLRLVLFLLLAACSAAPVAPIDTSTLTSTSTSTTQPDPLDTGDLVEATVITVRVDGEPLLVALAATPEARSQGLRAVDDLGDLDGMLFTWGGDTVSSSFTMADTVIPLDIDFFAVDGSHVAGFGMVPCRTADCPSYSAGSPFAYALETPAGRLPGIDTGSRLELGD
jgi:uncharacterized membrane protein (UPF0127 family)